MNSIINTTETNSDNGNVAGHYDRVDNHVRYDRHIEEWKKILSNPERRDVALTWLNNNRTFDTWRHHRMYKLLEPFIVSDSEASWLTVGDGRFGSDGHALMLLGAKKVHCSDISDELLAVGKTEGFINEYSVQNAENLLFPDNCFDYILCKEAYHHCPRPSLALYEMFRVAKRAVVLIEPRDTRLDVARFEWLLNFIKFLVGRKSVEHEFEAIGNYLYSVSERELEKFALGFHKRYISFSGVNDVYEEGVEFVDLPPKKLSDILIVNRLYLKLKISNILCCLGFKKTQLLASVIYKSEPTSDLLERLSKHGWKNKFLPKNPYL